MVQYGADIHAMEMGSGFPTKNSDDLLPEDEVRSRMTDMIVKQNLTRLKFVG